QKKKSVYDLKMLDIEKKRLTSPIDGIVTRVYFEKGETVSAGDKFAEIVQMDDLYLIANVPSGEVDSFKQGTEVKFKVDGQPGHFDAKVIFLSPIIDASSDTVRVKLEAKNVRIGENTEGAYALKPGMVATLLKK
ncbi:MAG: efflux RND transporter periplasmic adaptor subunit, partial [Bdellovibrionota bacterium]